MAKESIKDKIKRFDEAVKENIPGKVSLPEKAFLFADFMSEYAFHGTYLLDYMQYSFWEKRKRDRRNYVVHGKLLEMMKICNDPAYRYLFDQKPEFDKKFKKFLHRDFLDLRTATEEDFRKFLSDKDSFFVKEPAGMFGKGVFKVNTQDIEDVSAAFKEYKSKDYLCEGVLTQCREMAEFNDTSINTLRIVTILKADGEVQIMGGLLRVGRKGRIADNFHHMGIAAYMDPATGIVCTTGLDKNGTRHVVHPDSGKQIVGFQVPIWDKVAETVKEAALVVPQIRYVGWDVVITEDYEVALVEGNPGADPDAEQITTRQGRWPLYWELLKDIKDLKKA